ncbi:MAG: hypothetical protein Q4G27_04975 [Flavobacteriaceae bacterium]|nr:hypothetical protein [Flavobacteriaceae bacterium]
MNIEETENDSIFSIHGITPYNWLGMQEFTVNNGSYQSKHFTASLAECQPAYLVPNCVVDGNSFDEIMHRIFTQNWSAAGSEGQINLKIHIKTDSLRFIDPLQQSIVYWKIVEYPRISGEILFF